ncbi:hypothetical protein [Pseudoalteromonas xiamenensis]
MAKKNRLESRLIRWLGNRYRKERVEFRHHNIYILPTNLGWLFLFFTTLVFILGVNYQNNLLLFSSYFFSLFQLLTFFQTFKNINSLRAEILKCEPSYSPNSPRFLIRFTIKNKTINQLKLKYDNQEVMISSLFEETSLWLETQWHLRGRYELPRITLETSFPFGLVRAWCYWQPTGDLYIYPNNHRRIENQIVERMVSDDRDYQGPQPMKPGENPSRISWKHFAKSGELFIKQFAPISDSNSTEAILNYHDLFGTKEEKLAQLSTLLFPYYESKLPIKVNLPNSGLMHCTDNKTYHQVWEKMSEY